MRRARLSTLLFFLGAQTVFAGSLVHVGKLAVERFGASGGTADVIVYDPATFEIVETRALERPLTDHAAVLLPNGTVLLLGGATEFGEKPDVWLYRPDARQPRRRAVGR